MHTRTCLYNAALLGLAALTLAPAARAAAPVYALTDLGVLPGGISSAGGQVNNSGQVAGDSLLAGSPVNDYRTFLSGPNGGPLKDLGTLPGASNTTGFAVNDKGQVAGSSGLGYPQDHAFLSGPNGGALQDLGTLPGDTSSEGLGVNAGGQVTGYSWTPDGTQHGFLSDPNGGTLHALGTLGGDTEGMAVNASGQVTGYSGQHAFLTGPNGVGITDLGSLQIQPVYGSTPSFGNAVNAGGEVTGYSQLENRGPTHAFLFANGHMNDLGTLPNDQNSFGLGINDQGQVVGESAYDLDPNDYRAFLYSDGVMTDLNTLIDPSLGFRLTEAHSISDTGFISGTGFDKDGNQVAFLLTPAAVPEASSAVSFGLLLALGLGSLVVARRKHARS